MTFLSLEVALYLYKSSIQPRTEYCCHVWSGAPSCYFELSDKLQKQITSHSQNLEISAYYPVTYDVNGLKSGINRHILTVGFFLKQIYCMFLSFCTSFACDTMPCSGCSALHGMNPHEKKALVTDQMVLNFNSAYQSAPENDDIEEVKKKPRY